MLTAFTNGTIYTGAQVITGKTLLAEQGKIRALVNPAEVPTGATVVDCNGHIVAPGLLDLQIYGGGGYLFSAHPSPEALNAMAQALVKSGTTGFLLTLATDTMEVFHECIRIVRNNPHPAVLGMHLEGPYINPAKKGAHTLELIKRPERAELESLLAAAGGMVKMITVAPEMCDPAILRWLDEQGIILSAGHSNATFKEAMEGFQNGVRAVTHLFNAMSSLLHRDTGLPGATFRDSSVYASIIADNIHVDDNALIISKKVMGNRLFLITDAVEANNTGASQHVAQEDHFTRPDGTLSGSRLTLMRAVQRCVQYAGIPLDEALRMATVYPATLMGIKDRGRIEPGCRADLVIFDHQYKVQKVYIAGAQQ
ncbi:N-acetylglucosamine-6-phosphate deacetylase [Chitinophaga sp. G-6-1-13]|uniref:N-acetylglucosamine-6-phosphate deacetylase n=1 Tax=Chitinophaga fulva TaxID=2728842 RepID=A0A848GVY8_9BACT|nr:N-acetylglucosamine-6-phosphate deacetylase [Chitinophaga fulva]NML39858.1 N-acetylglucosamine-6-phosphate deacetylase [Chitinophaga fulva]